LEELKFKMLETAHIGQEVLKLVISSAEFRQILLTLVAISQSVFFEASEAAVRFLAPFHEVVLLLTVLSNFRSSSPIQKVRCKLEPRRYLKPSKKAFQRRSQSAFARNSTLSTQHFCAKWRPNQNGGRE
jgi:hypothetical protein